MSYSPPVQDGPAPGPILTPVSPEFPTSRVIHTTSSLSGAGAWPSANKPVAIPFWLQDTVTAYQLGFQNGFGTIGDHIDVGIYNASWVRQVSTGATTRSGANTSQWVDIADTVLTPGRYYLAACSDQTTANNVGIWAGPSTAAIWGMFGLYDSATNAYPLPDPLTNMGAAATHTKCPILYIALRAIV